jgi:ERCC4-type nuclease
MIVIDSRKGSAELMPYFEHNRIEAVIGTLDFADFAFQGLCGWNDTPTLIGVERKALRDFLACGRDGRFAGHQLPGLLDTYRCISCGGNHVWVVVEGVFRADKDGVLLELRGHEPGTGKAKWEPLVVGKHQFLEWEVTSFVNSIEICTPLKVRYCKGKEDTAKFVAGLERSYQKSWADHRVNKTLRKNPAHDLGKRGMNLLAWDKEPLVRRWAACLRDVGYERSGAVCDVFKTVGEMVGAASLIPAEELAKKWREVDGIGKSISASVVKEMRGNT